MADEALADRLQERHVKLSEEERQEILDAITAGLPPTEDIEAKLDARIADLEKRLPAEATLEKVASVNDAILATKLESLDESLKQLREQSLKELEGLSNSMLGRWDVAVVVFAILAAISGILGAIFGIINFVSD